MLHFSFQNTYLCNSRPYNRNTADKRNPTGSFLLKCAGKCKNEENNET